VFASLPQKLAEIFQSSASIRGERHGNGPGRYDDAISRLREVARRMDIADYYLGLALYYAGQQSEADRLLNRLGGGETRNVCAAAAALASILAAAGRRTQASRIAARIARQSTLDHHIAYSLGAAYAQLGDASQALRWLPVGLLTRLRQQHEGWVRRYGE